MSLRVPSIPGETTASGRETTTLRADEGGDHVFALLPDFQFETDLEREQDLERDGKRGEGGMEMDSPMLLQEARMCDQLISQNADDLRYSDPNLGNK